MTVVRNYAAQASSSLQELMLELPKLNYLSIEAKNTAARYQQGMFRDAWIIEHSQHFTMPDGGRIFDDKLKGLRNTAIRLPFKRTTIEFFRDKGYLVSAEEVYKGDVAESDGFTPRFISDEEEPVIVVSVTCLDENGKWFPIPFHWVIPTLWDNSSPQYQEVVIRFKDGETCSLYAGILPLLPSSIVKFDEYRTDFFIGVVALLEFSEALSCTNVSTGVIQEESKANPKRVRQGKVPIWETKILTLNVPGKSTSGRSTGGTHNSPKQHLRRGHIRRLPSGNVWVNSCVVGSAENGNVEKNYKVSKRT